MSELIEIKEAFLEEEIRCLEWCYQNPDECDEDEINERQNYIDELEEEINILKNK